jgi:lysophospholipase L1-like esterase
MAAVLWKSGVLHQAAYAIGWNDKPPGGYLRQALEAHEQADRFTPDGSVLFFGDSHTQSLVTSSVSPNSVNFGIGGLRARELLRTMPKYKSLGRASRVFVMVGTNDVRSGADLRPVYSQILATIKAPVMLSSIPPMAGFDTEPARQAAMLACNSVPNCTFVDLNSSLSTDHLWDGVHLKASGYEVWVNLMRSAVKHSAP